MPTTPTAAALAAAFILAATLAPACAETLKIATWNLDWLTLRPAGDPAVPPDAGRRSPAQLDRLRRYADWLRADVVAFQEVDGEAAARTVFSPDRYDLVVAGGGAVQRVGFAIRHGLGWRRNPDLSALDLRPDAPFPLRAGADIVLDLPSGPLRLLTLHLKSGCADAKLTSRRPACDALRRQAPALADWLAARRREDAAFVMLGDFNRVLAPDDALFRRLDRAAPLTDPAFGRNSPCWETGPFIDHILIGGAARDWLAADGLRVMVYRETDPALKPALSDHCPVSALFKLPAAPEVVHPAPRPEPDRTPNPKS